jgi:hypothetical protein
MGLLAATSTRLPWRAISTARCGDVPKGSNIQGAGVSGEVEKRCRSQAAAMPSGRGGKKRANGPGWAGTRPGRKGLDGIFTPILILAQLHGKMPGRGVGEGNHSNPLP